MQDLVRKLELRENHEILLLGSDQKIGRSKIIFFFLTGRRHKTKLGRTKNMLYTSSHSSWIWNQEEIHNETDMHEAVLAVDQELKYWDFAKIKSLYSYKYLHQFYSPLFSSP